MDLFSRYLKKVLTIPLHVLAQKLLKKISNKLNNKIDRAKDMENNTHIDFEVPLIQNSYMNIQELDLSKIDKPEATYLSNMYCSHRFDLLGSGWVKNNYDSVALGVEGCKYDMNVPTLKSISKEYEPIDWQKDYKSGYRWNENTWYKDISYGKHLGVDIKVPWELARMQHLPQLAIFTSSNEELLNQNLIEFKNQILDFITYNPPRFGVNWSCTMDVGIRVANMLVAYDMFYQVDSEGILNDEFKQTFSNSVYEHGLHIINNLEFRGDNTSNHYLNDIVGLLFVSAYLESTNEINSWLAFAIQELIWCMKTQFYEDGGNFESSTNYHILSAELMVFSTALIQGLQKEKILSLQKYNYKKWKIKPKLLSLDKQEFSIDTQKLTINLPQWYIDRLFKAGRFTVDLTKPSGEIPQIGDNDSGRFFRLSPNGQFITNREAEKKYLNLQGYNELIKEYVQKDELYWDENILDHSTFISAMGGLYEEEIFKNNVMLENSIIASMAKQKLTINDKSYTSPIISGEKIDLLPFSNEIIYASQLTFKNLKQISYPDSGIYMFKADNLHLTICAVPLGQNGNGGHTHNDKLSYELWLDGKDIIKDPGTYLYTPLPHRRNEFRSTKVHNIPMIDNLEQNEWNEGVNGLFHILGTIDIKVHKLNKDSILLDLKYEGISFQRQITIKNQNITVIDFSNKSLVYSNNFNYYSNGYGKLYEEK